MRYSLPVLVGVVVVASLAVVAILYARTDRYPNHRFASFERNFAPVTVELMASMDLGYSGYYFAGQTDHTIYLSHPRNPSLLIATDHSLADTSHYFLRVNTDSLRYRSIRVAVDSPYYYLADGSQPFIYRGVLGGVASPWVMDVGFTQFVSLSDSSVALSLIINMENTLARKVRHQTLPELFPEILEEQGDGIFSTDGMLRYDRGQQKLVYLYYYRNEYIVIDTAFQAVRCGHTIDTVSKARVQTGTISSRNSVTMIAPALRVNNESFANDGLIYVHSNLLARNEDSEMFKRVAAIDVYDLEVQRYRHSFYLPSWRDDELREFILTGEAVFALYHSRLVRYRMIHKDIVAQ